MVLLLFRPLYSESSKAVSMIAHARSSFKHQLQYATGSVRELGGEVRGSKTYGFRLSRDR